MMNHKVFKGIVIALTAATIATSAVVPVFANDDTDIIDEEYPGSDEEYPGSDEEDLGSDAVSRAESWVGIAEYVWGACSPGAFDDSGLVSYCLTGSFTRLGTTYTFLTWPQTSNPQPGDVCVNAGHCGIYVGNGEMIHAACEELGVIRGPVQKGMIFVKSPY